MPIPSSFYYAECLLGTALFLSHQVQFYTLHSFLTIFAEEFHGLKKELMHGCNIPLKRKEQKLVNAHFCDQKTCMKVFIPFLKRISFSFPDYGIFLGIKRKESICKVSFFVQETV
jgi:hypothetical protein